MNKRERIFNLLEGKPVDRTPTGFWLHFPEQMHHGDDAVKAHLDFMRETDTDILKIMNENLFHCNGTKFSCLSDIKNFRRFTRKDKIFQDQMDIIKRVTEKAGNDVPTLATIHGLVVSTTHSMGYAGKYMNYIFALCLMCRERPNEMKDVFKMISESLMELIDCCLEAGVDGTYYAAMGSEFCYFTKDEFEEFIAPYEKAVLDHAKSKCNLNILHICKSGIDLSRYQGYRPQVVNWAVHKENPSLLEGEKFFPGSILFGGFDDRSGVLVDGTEQEIEAETHKLLDQMKGKPFILGSDCTLPTEISYQRIHDVVKAVKTYYGN